MSRAPRGTKRRRDEIANNGAEAETRTVRARREATVREPAEAPVQTESVAGDVTTERGGPHKSPQINTGAASAALGQSIEGDAAGKAVHARSVRVAAAASGAAQPTAIHAGHGAASAALPKGLSAAGLKRTVQQVQQTGVVGAHDGSPGPVLPAAHLSALGLGRVRDAGAGYRAQPTDPVLRVLHMGAGWIPFLEPMEALMAMCDADGKLPAAPFEVGLGGTRRRLLVDPPRGVIRVTFANGYHREMVFQWIPAQRPTPSTTGSAASKQAETGSAPGTASAVPNVDSDVHKRDPQSEQLEQDSGGHDDDDDDEDDSDSDDNEDDDAVVAIGNDAAVARPAAVVVAVAAANADNEDDSDDSDDNEDDDEVVAIGNDAAVARPAAVVVAVAAANADNEDDSDDSDDNEDDDAVVAIRHDAAVARPAAVVVAVAAANAGNEDDSDDSDDNEDDDAVVAIRHDAAVARPAAVVVAVAAANVVASIPPGGDADGTLAPLHVRQPRVLVSEAARANLQYLGVGDDTIDGMNGAMALLLQQPAAFIAPVATLQPRALVLDEAVGTDLRLLSDTSAQHPAVVMFGLGPHAGEPAATGDFMPVPDDVFHEAMDLGLQPMHVAVDDNGAAGAGDAEVGDSDAEAL